jgi:hypothetical protein
VVAPVAVTPAVVETPAPVAAIVEAIAADTAEAAPAVIEAEPDVAPELAQDIAAPQYGIGRQLFDATPDAAPASDADRRNDAQHG